MAEATKFRVGGNDIKIKDSVARDQISELNTKTNELSSNLEQLEYSDVAGGKNLCSGFLSSCNVASDGIITSGGNFNVYYAKVNDGDVVSYSFTKGQYAETYYNFTSSIPQIGVTCISDRVQKQSEKVENITVPSGANYIVVRTNNDASNIQIEKGTTTPYEPYIPSVKMLADDVKAQNDSLGDYGLDNKCDGLSQGYWDDTCTFVSSNNDVCNSTVIPCKGGDVVTIKNVFEGKLTYIKFFDSNNNVLQKTSSNWNSFTEVAPNGAVKFCYSLNKNNAKPITPSEVGKITVYINNQIDNLKNDLIGFKFVPFTNADFTYQDSYKFWTKTVSDSSGKNPIAVVVNATNDNTANLTAVIRDGNTIRISSPNYNSIGSLTFTGYYVLM